VEQLQRASLVQQQSLSLKLGQKQLQSLQLMSLPLADLQRTIQEELESNPALELRRGTSSSSARQAGSYSQNVRSQSARSNASAQSASDAVQNFLEGALAKEETLQALLLSQLSLQKVDDDVVAVAELLIQNLNSDGFNVVRPEHFIKAPLETRDTAVALVRSLDPVGCCTDNWEQSLVVQAELKYGVEAAREIAALVALLAANKNNKLKPPELARKLSKTEPEFTELFNMLKTLTPFPGRNFAQADTRYVVPDVEVRRRGQKFTIVLNNEEIPVLGIAPFFLARSDKDSKKKLNKDERGFISEKVK
jgi:RNA polymerase sigma-54 factor